MSVAWGSYNVIADRIAKEVTSMPLAVYKESAETIETMEVRQNKYLKKFNKILFGTVTYIKEGEKFRQSFKFGKSYPLRDKLLTKDQFTNEFVMVKAALIFGNVASIKINGKFIKEDQVNDYGI